MFERMVAVKKDLKTKIEELRRRLNKICPEQKEKLLLESRKLDRLIVEYYKSTSSLEKRRLMPLKW